MTEQTKQLESAYQALEKINELLHKSKTDKSISKKDLEVEKRNCLRNIKKLKKS